MVDHGAKTATKFLEDDVICRYGIPKFVLTNNGGEWATKFDVMCKDYSIQHQHTTPRWPQCNGMAKHLIKTIKHGITIFFATPKNITVGMSNWPRSCLGIGVGFRPILSFLPFMIMTGHTPHLRVDNYLHFLIVVIDDNVDVEIAATKFLQKTILEIMSYATTMFATGMQLLVACNYARSFMQLQWIFAPFLGVYATIVQL